MQLLAPLSPLTAALNAVRSAADTKTTIAILGCFKIAAVDNTLTLTANNMRLQASATLDATIGMPGEVCVNAERLAAFISHASKDIGMEMRGDQLHLSSGRMKVDLPTIPSDGFALLAMREAPVSFEVPGMTMAQLIGAVSPSVLDNNTFPALCGLLLEGRDNEFWVVGSDTKRLTAMRGASGVPDFQIVLPIETAVLLRRVIGKSTDNMRIELTDRLARFTFGTFQCVTRLIDAPYPDYRRIVVPRAVSSISSGLSKAERTVPVIFDVEPLLLAARRALAIIEEGAQPVSLHITTNGESMVIASEGIDLSGKRTNFVDEIDAEGPTVSFTVQARFMRDAMLALGGEGQAELAYHEGQDTTPDKARFNRLGQEGEFVILVPLRQGVKI